MTGIQIFAFVALPLGIAACGVAVTMLNDWNDRRKHRLHPGE